MTSVQQFYCQKCLAANRFDQELCGRCGTRLMLVVEPPAMRYDQVETPTLHEEHLLERVSALEYRLCRMTERLEQTLELLLRQARNTYFDHALIETLVSVLGENGTVASEVVEERWFERCRQDAAEQQEAQRREALLAQVLASHQGGQQGEFKRRMEEGLSLLSDGKSAQGIRALERAASLSNNNAPLNAFIGEHYFGAGKMVPARDYLERAWQAAPLDDRVCLLLALALGDDGEAVRAEQLLRELLQRGFAPFAAHYALGRLLAAEERWPEALAVFKSALAVHPSAETHYVMGCVYYSLGRDRLAERHLRQAIELDNDYSAALHTLGLVFLRGGDVGRAREAFRSACAAGQDEACYRNPHKGKLQPADAPTLPPLFRAARYAKKRLVTGGDRRLAEAVRMDALSSGFEKARAED